MVGTTLRPFVVVVTNSSGVPVAGVDVTFTVTAGGGTVPGGSPQLVTTDSQGVASITLTLGATGGTNTVTATATGLSGSPLTFNAAAIGTFVPIITTVAGSASTTSSGDGGPATSAGLAYAYGLAVDAAGNFYVSDTVGNRIRKIDTNGTITTVAGTGTASFSGDNGTATSATISGPEGLTIDGAGNLYFSDFNNNRIRKVNGTTGIITTVAGNGTATFSGDNGLATSASLSSPKDVTVDRFGNLYIADSANTRVRKVDTSGIITTVAGNGSQSSTGDGGLAIAAGMSAFAVAVDAAGNIYIADSNRIRKVDTSGIINTIAGNGSGGSSGDGGLAISATLSTSQGVTVDAAGNLYFADTIPNARVRKIDTLGIINTVAGDGTTTFKGDGGPATSASLQFPEKALVDASGNFLIADGGHNRVRKVTYAGRVSTTSLNSQPGSAVTIPVTLSLNSGLTDRKSTRLNSSHIQKSRMPSSA